MDERSVFPTVEVAHSPTIDGLLYVTVFSRHLGRRVDLTLFAPTGSHVNTANAAAVVLLHGVYGSHWSWARNGAAHQTVQRMVDEGSIDPLILVMPSDGLYGVGSGYVDRAGEDAESWIVDELPRALELVFPSSGSRLLCVGGLSMGGYGALRLALRHPEHFVAASAMSPLENLAQVRDLAPPELAALHDVVNAWGLVESLQSCTWNLPPAYICCGLDDGLLPSARSLRDNWPGHLGRLVYRETPGAHNWDFWTAELGDVLRFFSTEVRAARRSARL